MLGELICVKTGIKVPSDERMDDESIQACLAESQELNTALTKVATKLYTKHKDLTNM